MACYLLHAGQSSAQRLLRRVGRLREYRSVSALRPEDTVIRWGDSAESDAPEARVLNPQNAVARTRSRSAMVRFLRRVGVRVYSRDRNGDTPSLLRQYRIPIFDLTPLACFRSDRAPVWLNQRLRNVQASFREVPFDEEKLTARVLQLACRALHAVGLDHGMVSIGMAPQGVLYVLDVTPSPVLMGRMLELFSHAIDQYIDREEGAGRSTEAPVRIGTDVELMLRNAAGRMVLASKFLSRKGRVGCDDRSVQFDGQRLPLMELRPEPDADPLRLVANLHAVMEEASDRISRPGIQWLAGSMPFRPYCTGGHIHFSNVPYSSHFVRVLDNYLGLPLMMVEDPKTGRLRRTRYGFLGDVRQKDHGGFEYRTPASFVVSPEITAAAFCIAYLVAQHHRDLPVFDLYEENIQLAFYQARKDVLLPIVKRNHAILQELPEYPRYREYIEPLFELIWAGQTWDESVDVRTVWGIPVRRRKAVPRTAVRRSAAHA
ncbi:putative amidoligase domain-containing protein [Alicyclobacillus macrosporangiidus]|jgi:hypothetical protein|uniref:Phage phiEco32-like COOH.NH2 ligase-type 2 n=1 Tax=Alicyclobacillus macrosporangiidus TaxID=392015 RepID=A0A1I7ITU3_9BACL|nr:hypothetical protein [Alicyclobacillus macrosporangiidus]SFU76356.1 Phage phiEco32-like COOH.NH2 ligase-type 2 [Alicyclobacillus macrosporangiidus]